MSVWVMPSVDVYENFLKRSQAVAGGRRRSQAVGTPNAGKTSHHDLHRSWPRPHYTQCAALSWSIGGFRSFYQYYAEI